MISPPSPLTPNPDDSKAPPSSPVAGAAGGAFSTSVAPTSNGGIGQSGSEPGTTTDTYNRDRRSLAGLRPTWMDPDDQPARGVAAMSASGPALWRKIAQLVARVWPVSSIEIADGLALPRHSTTFSCGAMARRGYLECVGKTKRPTRRDSPTRSQSRIYVVTAAGRAMDAPPPADARDERPIVHGFGYGKCTLAECLGLGRRA